MSDFDFKEFMLTCMSMYKLSHVPGRPDTYLTDDADICCEITEDLLQISVTLGDHQSSRIMSIPETLDEAIKLYWESWGKLVQYCETEQDFIEEMQTIYNAPFKKQ